VFKVIGRKLIEDTSTPKNSRDSMIDIVVALRELYKDVNYRNQILTILDEKVNTGKSSTARPGMDLWEIFVPAQIRLAKRLSYGELHTQANYNKPVRQMMGIEAKRKIGAGRSKARCVFLEEPVCQSGSRKGNACRKTPVSTWILPSDQYQLIIKATGTRSTRLY
jgi:uncharacterized protein (UPF0147 family)